MKYSVAILALAAAATAQKIDACDGKAQPCIEDAIAESGLCEAGDEACACENMETIQGGATSCVIEACGGAAEARMLFPFPRLIYLVAHCLYRTSSKF